MEEKSKQIQAMKTKTQSPRTIRQKVKTSRVDSKKNDTKTEITKTEITKTGDTRTIQAKRKKPSSTELSSSVVKPKAKSTVKPKAKSTVKPKAKSTVNPLPNRNAKNLSRSESTTNNIDRVNPLVRRRSKEFIQFSDFSKEQSIDNKEEESLTNSLDFIEPAKAKPSLSQRIFSSFRSLFQPKKERAEKQSSFEEKNEDAESTVQGLKAQEISQDFESTIFQKEAIERYSGKHEQYELNVEDLHKKFGRKEVVCGISFSVKTGEVVGFLGPNGAGKTTAFYMIVGFITPDKGTIIFNGKKISDLAMHQRARLGISYLPQEPSVFRRLSVEHNILAILETIPRLSRQEMKDRLEILLRDFGLQSIRKQKAFTLSGGERRRTEIARSMSLKPHFLLLDEPFTGIDPKARHELKLIISALAKRGVGILITDHNERDTLSITERVYILNQGKIAVTGSQEEIMSNIQVREIYLGTHYDI